MTQSKHFWTTVAAVLVGVYVTRALDHLGVFWLALLGALALGAVLVGAVRYWWRGRHGLDQWPEAHGRYYTEWMGLPAGHGDYYEWLAAKHGNREPWRTWAAQDKNLKSDEDE